MQVASKITGRTQMYSLGSIENGEVVELMEPSLTSVTLIVMLLCPYRLSGIVHLYGGLLIACAEATIKFQVVPPSREYSSFAFVPAPPPVPQTMGVEGDVLATDVPPTGKIARTILFGVLGSFVSNTVW